MEINFEKRYLLVYTLILATIQHITININSIFENAIKSIWPIDAIVLVITLLFLSIFTRNQKQRISLGILYRKTPFEKASQYVENDERIDLNNIKVKNLKNISNKKFYNIYYKAVRDIKSVETKNSEYCVVRDIVFTIFIMVILLIILTSIWPQQFYRELIAGIVAYIIGAIACNMKAKEFVSQIVAEFINKEEN